MLSNCLVFHTSGSISSSPAHFLFLIFLRTESSSSCVNGPSLMSNCLLIILVIGSCVKVVAEGNFIFWFGVQLNSTHNFTQSGWLNLFIPDPFPGSRNWVSCQTHSLWLKNAILCRRLTGGFSIAAAAWTHEGTFMDSLRLFSLRPRNPSWIWIRYIQYATHRNNFMSPPKLAMSMRCLIPLPTPSSHFTSGQH